jgi:hypothetical protein
VCVSKPASQGAEGPRWPHPATPLLGVASGDTAIGSQSRLQTSDSGRQGSALYGETPKNATQTHLPRAGRLDENAEPSRTKVRRDSRTMRAFMLALLCGRRAKAYPINYLQIAKTGSTSLNIAIKEAQAAGHQCDDIKVRFHHFTALNLRRRQKDFTDPPSFVVLREPCERFVSIYYHLKTFRLPKNDPIHTTTSAREWGLLILRNASMRSTFLYHGQMKIPPHHHPMVAWQQAAYVSPATRVACLPKLQEDVTRILNTSVPGCILPKFGHANVRNHTAPNEEDCDVAARLYHEDFEIWRAHCGS